MTWKFLLMVSILVACVFIFRMFCRFICPLGALYGLFNKFSFFGVKIEQPKCTNCNLCVNHCKMDIKHVGDPECINCGECIDVCPTNAIVWKGLKKKESKSDTNKKAKLITRAISCILLATVLITSVTLYWNDSSNIIAEKGTEVGDACYGADLYVVDSNGISNTTINPTEIGKITIINFWGTWCTPCVNELPYFDQIATNYKDDVSVIAVHTNMIIDTAPEYISSHYPESNIIFASDIEEEGYYSLLGGRGTYPYTVVIDENGVIIQIFFEALEYEDLDEIVKTQLN